MKPIRLQRKRTRGFDLKAESLKANGLPVKCVSRGTRYGNPYWVGKEYRNAFTGKMEPLTKKQIPMLYRIYLNGMLAAYPDYLDALRGHNLACWCPKNAKWCHANELLKRANL